MSYIRVGAPRNTSNGDYGRFHFTPNMSSGQHQMHQQQQNSHYSSNGNRMMQHVHYPNCPNRNSPNKFSDGMKDYTVEYGEDAVRAALGGSYPDFQAEFQKQYGTNEAGAGPQAIQMTNNGQSKVAMIPVVLTSEGDEEANKPGNADADNNNDAIPNGEPDDVSNQTSCGDAPVASKAASTIQTQMQQESPAATMVSKQENLINAYESARRARSTGQVKYGRHVRPSYWKPETPNPCRKKMTGCGGGDVNDAGNDNQAEDTNPGMAAASDMQFMGNPNNYSNEMTMNPNGYFAPPPMIPANAQQQNLPVYQRTHSLPPKQAVRPTYSLCGKCKKCKNLRSETPEASVLTFPKYSTGGFQRQSQMLTSSNLGQSAKNFRAIRFSSNHM